MESKVFFFIQSSSPLIPALIKAKTFLNIMHFFQNYFNIILPSSVQVSLLNFVHVCHKSFFTIGVRYILHESKPNLKKINVAWGTVQRLRS